jgi:release factor glutamine methyltransferase
MIYAPSEDSFLLAECVRLYHGKGALEIGVGSGIILDALADRFDFVAGTDIEVEALRLCKRKTNALLVCSDSAFAFAPLNQFDLIVSNPPYLPNDGRVIDPAVHGGPHGIEVTTRFIASALPVLADAGRILVVMSSLADHSAFDSMIANENLKKKVIKEKRLFYETLSVVEISRKQLLLENS